MAGRLTTHVLDLLHGKPAAGMRIDLWAVPPDDPPPALGDTRNIALLKTVVTNQDGRVDGPLLEGDGLVRGNYELVFHVAAYFAAHTGTSVAILPAPPFLGRVPVRFGVADAGAHYHVPLLVTPWAYSTYRGS